jgi:hypothetical protein
VTETLPAFDGLQGAARGTAVHLSIAGARLLGACGAIAFAVLKVAHFSGNWTTDPFTAADSVVIAAAASATKAVAARGDAGARHTPAVAAVALVGAARAVQIQVGDTGVARAALAGRTFCRACRPEREIALCSFFPPRPLVPLAAAAGHRLTDAETRGPGQESQHPAPAGPPAEGTDDRVEPFVVHDVPPPDSAPEGSASHRQTKIGTQIGCARAGLAAQAIGNARCAAGHLYLRHRYHNNVSFQSQWSVLYYAETFQRFTRTLPFSALLCAMCDRIADFRSLQDGEENEVEGRI